MELEPLENPIVIHPHLLQRFLKHGKDYANLLALYSFYIYHAQRQKTNQPLVTDDFTRKGMNWAIDRVKKTKKILKEMKLIEVVQKQKYYYVHLFFIYTKKKLGEILGNCNKSLETLETKTPSPTKATKSKTAPKASAPSVPPLFTKWIDYCNKHKIKYSKSNINHWQKKLKDRVTIEKREAIYSAISNRWKDFYLVPIKESKYHKFLGQSLMMERDCDTLLDIDKKDGRFFYQFKNLKISSTVEPFKLFQKYGYKKEEVKKAPIIYDVKEKILSVVKRF